MARASPSTDNETETVPLSLPRSGVGFWTVRRAEVHAVGRLAGEILAGSGALIGQFHAGIAERAFGHAPASTPVRLIHDGVSRAVYAGVGRALRGVALAGAELAARRAPTEAPALDSDPRAAIALGALSGLSGDRVVRHSPELAPDMEIRALDGRRIELTADGVSGAFGAAT